MFIKYCMLSEEKFYEKANILKHVDGMGTIEQVNRAILALLNRD